MPYSLITKTSVKWKAKKSGELNKLNTDCLFETDNKFGFPEVCSDIFTPKDLIPFHTCKDKKIADRDNTVHFFLDDYKFESVWSSPYRYDDLLCFYGSMISPTFSVWENQPYALNLFNIYRSRWITRFYQECYGIKVLVDVRWSTKDSYEYCFSGIKKHSPVIVNTVGTRMTDNRKLFRDGFEEMLKVVEPSDLFVYGEYMPVEFEKYFDSVTYFDSFWAKQRAKMKAR